MTTGALIFAFNNEQTDYVAMARWSADNIRRHLDIPVAVVTDCTDTSRTQGFDRVIVADASTGGTRWFEDYQSTVTWHNAGRVDAYSLSPWDRTLVLDADYVVAGDMLKTALKSTQDFLCYKNAYDVTMSSDFDGLNYFGTHRLPMWWATVMVFNRTSQTKYIFDSMQMIRNNWQHYRDLYGINNKTYRNDYALSISLGIVSGHTWQIDGVPGMLPSVLPEHQLLELERDYYMISYQNQQGEPRTMAWAGMDFHAMGKRHLEKIVASH